MNNKRFGFSKRLVFLLTLLVATALVYANFQKILDYSRLYGYEPPAHIAKLADQTSMTDEGRKLFYVNHPSVEAKGTFNDFCSSHGESSIVLGCYHSVDRGIYLFDVTDERLDGVEQVTAAHEMLHAAYDRLKGGERDRINNLLTDYYENELTDQRIIDTIESYENNEPNDIVNEMHSIFATEIATLPAELEDYFAQYFNDRSRVVEYANHYQQEFTSRRQQVQTYDDRLATIKARVEQNTQTLKSQNKELEALQTQMNTDRSSGRVEEYNAQVPIYNARIADYNNLVSTTQALIAEYNRLIIERNNIALEVKGLADSIDSRLTPISQ